MSVNATVPDEGEIQFLLDLLAHIMASCIQHLFSNNIVVTASTVYADFTECTFAGYSEWSYSGWSTPTIQGDGSAGSSPAPSQFSCTASGGSGTIYGGYVSDVTDTYCLWAFNFPSPYVVIPDGVTLTITPLFTVLSRY